MSADIVIRGGTVVDGTGAPGRPADVAVTGGRISDIGPDLQGDRVLDASGQVVSPGFIDIHTHYDAQVFWDPNLTPSSFHGVTTVIAGNCGFSIAPIRADGVPLLARTLQHVEDMSFDTLAAGVPWGEFETFPQYLDAVEARGTALNFGCYVGHTAVRLYVMGEDAYERPATDDEIVAHAGRGGRRHGGRRRRLRLERVADPQRRQRPAGAVAGGRPGRAARVARAGQAVRARRGGAAAGRRLLQPGGLPAPARGRAAVHLDGAAHREGLPVPREGDRRARRGLGRRRRGVAAGVVPPAGLPDEPVRAVHAQHAPDLRRADGQVEVRAGRRLPRSGLAGDGVGRRERQGGRVPAQLGRHLGGRVALASRAGRPPGGGAGRGAGLHAARRDARRLAGRRPRGPLLVGAGQRRPRGHRLAAAARQRAARPGRLRAPTSRSSATPASRPTCSATGCASAG